MAAQIYAGVSSPVWGTLTFGRQNALQTDAVNAYDPMGGSYAFSPIGFSGFTCGAGDTEECRWTTAIKYRVNFGNFRLAVIGQPVTGTAAYNAYNPNNGAVEGDIGGDFKSWSRPAVGRCHWVVCRELREYRAERRFGQCPRRSGGSVYPDHVPLGDAFQQHELHGGG